MSTPKIPRLPFSRKFPLYVKVAFFPPGGGRGNVFEAAGSWTLLFEASRKSTVVGVKLKDIDVKVSPFTFFFDIDQDGSLEKVKVPGFNLRARDLILNESKGTIDLETEEFSMRFGIEVTSKSIPVLKELGGDLPRIIVTERGRFNFRIWRFHLESGVVAMPKGHVLADSSFYSSEEDHSLPDSTVKLSVWHGTYAAFLPPFVENRAVWTCPGDPITLVWEASEDVTGVRLDPVLGDYPPKGHRWVNPGPQSSTVYRAATLGGNTTAEDTVTVFTCPPCQTEFADAIDRLKFSATFGPSVFSPKIQVAKVGIKLPADPESNYVHWPMFTLVHDPLDGSPPTGIPVDDQSINRPVPEQFSFPGKWDFFPEGGVPNWDDIIKKKKILCFECELTCGGLPALPPLGPISHL